MKTTSASTYATPFIEHMAVDDNTPFDIVAAMEESFMRPATVPFNRQTTRQDIIESVAGLLTPLQDFKARRKLAEAQWTVKTSLRSNFGRWLQDDEKGIVENTMKELTTSEEVLEALPYVIEKVRSRKAWKEEQNRPQEPANYTNCEEVIYDLPPRTRGKSHEKAFYSMVTKSGRVIDLAQHEGIYNPIPATNPNNAMQHILTRLGGKVDGGEVEILNRLLREPKIEFTNEKDETSTEWKWLPSYVSQKRDGVWYVRIGWRLNPKVATGSFHRERTDAQLKRFSQLDQLNWFDPRTVEVESTEPFVENVYGELERYNPMAGHTPDQIVTLSQLDYKLLCENSSVTIEDPDGDVVAYMNEDEELVMQGMVRDDDHADEGMDSYLLTQAAAKMDRMIDLNVGSAVWLLPEFEDALLECSRDTRKEMSRAVKAVIAHKAKVTAHVQAYLSHQMTEEENAEMVKIGKDLAKRGRYLKSRTRSILERYRDEREDLASQTRINPEAKPNKLGFLPTPQSSQPDSYHGPDCWTDTAKSTGFDIRFNPQPTLIPGSHIMPLNTVPTPPARVADMKPACRVTMMQRVKQGTRALIGTKDGYVIKDIPSAKQRPTSARNASPKLTRVLRKMIREDLAYC